MGGFHPPIKKEIKEEILTKVKNGEKVLLLAKEYCISDRTIYSWLTYRATAEPGTIPAPWTSYR